MALRPTSDSLRETLFNILGVSAENSRWIDLYAGSGAVGIEALSRGAAEVIFIETHHAATTMIARNLRDLNIGSEARVITVPAATGLKQLAAHGYIADFVFLDPPYALSGEYDAALEFLGTASILSAAGIVIAEHARRSPLPERLSRLEQTRVVEQGDSSLSFYRRSASNSG